MSKHFGRGRRLASILALAAVGVVAAAASTASAAPQRHARAGTTAASGSTDEAAKFPDVKQAQFVGGTGLAASLRETRAKVNVQIPAVQVFAYAGTLTRKPIKDSPGYFPVPDGLLPARPDPACRYFARGIQNDLFVVDVDETNHRFRSVGKLPDVPVSMLAFGSVPVTAVLSTSQTMRNGKLLPIQANSWIGGGASIAKSDPAGVTSTTTGCDADWERDFPPVTISFGQIDARLSKVRVDGRPVDVGDQCRTTTPLQLRLLGEDGAHGGRYGSVTDGGELVQTRDTRTTGTANPIALFPKSENLTVPPFVGCVGASGQDISRLVSSFISGPGSTLSVNQSPLIFTYSNLTDPTTCDNLFGQGCVQLPTHLLPPPPG